LITLEGSGMIGVAGSSKDFEVLSQENVNVVLLLKPPQNILSVSEF
jgi:hypothetical protein